MALVFPKYLTKWTMGKLVEAKVDVKPNAHIDSVKYNDEERKIEIALKDGKGVVKADHVVLAVGISPNLEVAKNSGLEIDEKRSGIVVNAELEARSNVFAAGDVTSFHDITLGRRRVEHHDHAIMSGRLAGLNMTSSTSGAAPKPYTHQSMFWSDLGPQIAYEAVGIVDSSLNTVGIWAKNEEDDKAAPAEKANESPAALAEKYGRGAVFYMNKEKKIVGVLLWNLFGKLDFARKIIREQKTFSDIDELAATLN
ncbi:Apoptosis-inducing factor 1, mitochondrial, partial [Quaeritorhiza haematococci]